MSLSPLEHLRRMLIEAEFLVQQTESLSKIEVPENKE